MRVVALVPIKLNSQRLPHKSILPIAGHPLCWHVCSTLGEVAGIGAVYVYCSDASIKGYVPGNAIFKERPAWLDGDMVKGHDIYREFIGEVDADIYVLAHATSPFIRKESIQNALGKVMDGGHDSAFSARRIQTFAWYKGEPVNYDLSDVPRTQDIEPVWAETSAFFIFRKEVFTVHGRRIGMKPYIQEVGGMEAVDIDERGDYDLACRLAGGPCDGE